MSQSRGATDALLGAQGVVAESTANQTTALGKMTSEACPRTYGHESLSLELAL